MSERNYTIRPFEPADQARMRALVLTGLGEHWGFIDETLNPDLDDIAAAYPPETSLVLVVEEDGALIGAGCLTEDDPSTGRLVRMSVAASARGKGIGRRLVADLETAARARGYTRIVCETTETWVDATGLYLATGFSEVGIWDGDRHFEKLLTAP
jgi:ribosomal protein S18 acetylase RimI-like enzyme